FGLWLKRISHGRELVTVTMEGQDPDRAIGVGFELPSEPEYVSIDGAGRGETLVSPHLVEQSLARDHFASMRDQEDEQIELLARQPHLVTGLEYLAPARAHPHVAERELRSEEHTSELQSR